MKIIIIVVLILIVLWTLGSWLAIKNIEEPVYKVVEKKDGYEIRMYEPTLVAETTVSGSYDQALNQGFRNIADYIFGNNTKTQKISMTAPVIESDPRGGNE